MIHLRNAVLSSLLLGLSGCALLSKGDVPMRRYFSPDLPAVAAEPPVARSGCELRLGRVTAGASLGERIMFRESAHEVGFYDDRIWTEKPDAYLRRGLARTLFEADGLHSVMRGAGPTLDVELVTFEEVKAPVHCARVKIAFSLSDERIVSLQQTLAFERPIAGATAEAVAQAMGEALRDAIDEVSGRVVLNLSSAAGTRAMCSVAAN